MALKTLMGIRSTDDVEDILENLLSNEDLNYIAEQVERCCLQVYARGISWVVKIPYLDTEWSNIVNPKIRALLLLKLAKISMGARIDTPKLAASTLTIFPVETTLRWPWLLKALNENPKTFLKAIKEQDSLSVEFVRGLWLIAAIVSVEVLTMVTDSMVKEKSVPTILKLKMLHELETHFSSVSRDDKFDILSESKHRLVKKVQDEMNLGNVPASWILESFA